LKINGLKAGVRFVPSRKWSWQYRGVRG